MIEPVSSPDTTQPDAPSRRAIYRSTWVVIAFVASVVLVLNVFGWRVIGPHYDDGKYGPHFETGTYLEHGWPTTFVRRKASMLSAAAPQGWRRTSRWSMFAGVLQYSPLSLTANILMAATLIIASGFLFQWWRRKRYHVFEFFLADLFLLVLMFALVGGYYASQRSRRSHEEELLRLIGETKSNTIEWADDDPHSRVNWQRAAPEWLPAWLGRICSAFDRIVGIDTTAEELEHAAKFHDLKVIGLLSAGVNNRQLKMLESLPCLEALDLAFNGYDDTVDHLDENGNEVYRSLRIPKLPRLLGLNLYHSGFSGDGLENIPNIEILELTETDVDDAAVPALKRLTKLKRLNLYATKISPLGIEELRKALPDCEIGCDSD